MPVQIHLLQDVEAGELLAPLVLVQGRQHPEFPMFEIFHKLTDYKYTCSWAVLRQQGLCKWSRSLGQSDAQSHG